MVLGWVVGVADEGMKGLGGRRWGRAGSTRGSGSYRELEVWGRSMDLAVACYELTKGFPREEIYGMASQVRRAAVAVPANMAEGHGREMPGDFVRFLRIAQGSLKELETHLILASRVRLASEEEIEALLTDCDGIGKMLHALIRSIQKPRTKNQ